MTRIFITWDAYRAISGDAPPDHVWDKQAKGYGLWLEKSVLALLRASRAQGEGYSDTILRVAAAEVEVA